jgi:hypothetical protein
MSQVYLPQPDLGRERRADRSPSGWKRARKPRLRGETQTRISRSALRTAARSASWSTVAYIYPIEIGPLGHRPRSGGGDGVAGINRLNAKHAAANAPSPARRASRSSPGQPRARRLIARASRTSWIARLVRPERRRRGAAQYVIEDHALHHAWHHLAKIRDAVGAKSS